VRTSAAGARTRVSVTGAWARVMISMISPGDEHQVMNFTSVMNFIR
jgi:hypothetical protein